MAFFQYCLPCIVFFFMNPFEADASKPGLGEAHYALLNQKEFGHEETLHRLRRSANENDGNGNYGSKAATCRPGGFYCGSQLSAMGYRNAVDNYLYECDSAKDALYHMKCTSCVSSANGQAHCACFPGLSYCGHELRARNFRVTNDHALYRCNDTSSASVVQSCTRRCGLNKDTFNSECLNDNRMSLGRCQPDGLYCGYELGYLKFPNWQHNRLYLCEENGREVQPLRRCPSGCSINITASFCDVGRMLWNPMDSN